jgi:hypothetical protein
MSKSNIVKNLFFSDKINGESLPAAVIFELQPSDNSLDTVSYAVASTQFSEMAIIKSDSLLWLSICKTGVPLSRKAKICSEIYPCKLNENGDFKGLHACIP